ncbi:methyltransferase [Thalassotalea sp. PLHSN55]|uniref:methyltransferase n=1 Tax=Thalassotalea sp. PLHSN55 TaxID=3435888 RepID=UPI003F877D5C
MLSPFIVNDKNVFLERFPTAQVNRSLQAWDAADEYLVNYLNDQQLIKPSSKILLVNDAFGALTVNFTEQQVYCVNDSYLSQQGIINNLEQNNLDDSKLTLLSSLDSLPSDIDIVLFKIPKSKAMLVEQLIRLRTTYDENILFIAADRAKEIHSSTLKQFEKYLGDTKTSLAVKKARLVFSKFDSDLNNKSVSQSPYPTKWPLENTPFTITNHANVYAREKLDIGARYFMQNLPKVSPDTKVIDLGCGNGVIGLSVLAAQPQAQVQFFDESYMAIASAQANIEQNLPEATAQCQFHLNDCLTSVEGGSVDLILCNPPFHQQTATTDHIAWQMFKDSHRVLKKGGELRIIGNRQLGYHIKLKRIFGNETLIASNDKFVTISAKKR